jgi:hypothetical protein
MDTTLKKNQHLLSVGKTTLFTFACIALFIVVAVICDLLTSWIPSIPVRVVTRELLLRTPLTIFSLHLFASKVIKAYEPGTIYGKLILSKLLKWV